MYPRTQRTQLLWIDSGEVMKLWPCGFRIEYTHLGFASAGAVWLGLWNSDHVVLKFNIYTLALPWQQRSYWGRRVTKDAYFSLLTCTKQLLLVTFCDTLAGIEVSFWANGTGRTDRRTDGWTDRRESRNSYLDLLLISTGSSTTFVH